MQKIINLWSELISSGNVTEDKHNGKGGTFRGESSVSAAKHPISLQAGKGPSLDYSHFVSLPLATYPELVGKLYSFQNSILGNNNAGNQFSNNRDSGIEKSMFVNPKTFHLTVLMLKLSNEDEVRRAIKVLKNILPRVMDALDNRPVVVKLKGVACMRGSFAKAFVLYAPIEEIGKEDRLLRACQVIIEAFVEAGLAPKEKAKEKLKLHATLMNAKFKKSKTKSKQVDSFDARGIFEQFGSEEWGNYMIREAHLSQRFVYDTRGYFHSCLSVPFPTKYKGKSPCGNGVKLPNKRSSK